MKLHQPTWHNLITTYCAFVWSLYCGYASYRDDSRRHGAITVLITSLDLFTLPLHCEVISQALATVIFHCRWNITGLLRSCGQVTGWAVTIARQTVTSPVCIEFGGPILQHSSFTDMLSFISVLWHSSVKRCTSLKSRGELKRICVKIRGRCHYVIQNR